MTTKRVTPKPATYHLPDEEGMMLAVCWCGEAFQSWPALMIRRGHTFCCGRPDCLPDGEAA
jgi:hypothetical protein